jgi:hypothetical protein
MVLLFWPVDAQMLQQEQPRFGFALHTRQAN